MLKELLGLLDKKEFISVATCDKEGRPNAAPKFVLKADNENVYLVDYIMATTYRNLKVNPRVSMSFLDTITLKGYQINGTAGIIEKGRIYEKMRKEMLDKEIHLTTERIIQDVRGQTDHKTFEVEIADKYVIFKVSVEEVVEISPKGGLTRRKKGADDK